MVRETRYLWVGNLPKEITEEGVIEYFARYGKIQSVKLLSGKEEEKPSATVAFMDIKSAAKAHKCENKLNGVPLFTEYSEPTATGTTVTITRTLDPDGTTRDTHRSVFNAQTSGKTTARFPGRSDGLPEERNYDSQEYRYRVNEQYEGRRSTYEDGEQFAERGRLKQRFQTPQAMRAGFSSNRQQQYEREVTSQRSSFDASYSGERHSERGSGSSAGTERRSRQKAWGGQSPARSDASLTRSRSFRGRSTSRSPAGSRSSSSSSSRSSSSTSSRSRSRSSKASRDHQPSGPASVAIAPPNSLLDKRKESGAGSASGSSTTETSERKNLGICIRGLPIRSSDTSLRDGLFHEYKKHGKVTSVNVVGNGDDRYAIVSFKKPEDAAKALEASQDKMFFGTKIHVLSHEGFVFPVEVEDNEFKPPEAELDEYHPKATRTLFVGNLEKEITTQMLREIFKPFGEIIDIDIKKQGAVSAYAFVQYADIVSVVRALRKMDGEHIGNNKIKLGFGKSMPTNCVWLDCMTDSITEKKLCHTFGRYGPVSHSVIDRNKLRALVYFENMDYAQHAVNEMRGRALSGKKVQIDFASRDCQTAFFEKMERTGQLRPGERPDERQGRVFRQSTTSTRTGFQRSSSGGANSSTRSYRPGRGTGTRLFGDGYSDEFRDRTSRTRFDGDFGSEGYVEDSYEQELRDYGYRQQERRERTDSLSPTRERRVEGRSVSPFSVRSSRHTSPTERHERFEDRYGERYSNSERFRDTDSQSGDHESVRSYRSVRSEARREFRGDRPYEERYGDRFDEKSREARGFSPASSDYSQKSRSPGYQSRSPSPTPTKERKTKSAFGRPATPPSPGGDYSYTSRASSPGDYEGYKEAKVKDKSKEETLKSRNMRERFDSEERTSIAKLMGKTTLTSIAGEVKLRKQKLEVEEALTNADVEKSSKKAELERLLKKHPDLHLDKSMDSSDLRKIMEKTRSRSVSSVTRSRLGLEHGPADPPHSTVHRPVQEKNKLKDEAKHRKKYDKNAPYDPWDLPSGKSDSDSDLSGHMSSEDEPAVAAPGSSDYSNLQRERQHLLQLIQQLDDGGSDGAEAAEEEVRRMAKRARLEDCLPKNASPRLTSILESLKSNPKSSSFHPDASQSLRKQMEQRRRMEQQELRGDKSGGPKLLSPPGDHVHTNNEDMDITYEKSPREIPVEFLSKKKRKPDHGDEMSFPKLKRSYRTKPANDDMYGPSSGDEGEYHGVPHRRNLEERLAEELGRPLEKPEKPKKESSHSEPTVIKLNCDLGEVPSDPRLPPQNCPRHVLTLPLPRFARLLPPAPKISPKVQESPRAESPPPPPPPPPEDNSTKILSPPFSPGNKPYSPQDSPALKLDPAASDPSKAAGSTEDSKDGDKSKLAAPPLPASHKSPAVKPESSDSEVETAVSPTALSLEERIRALDEKLNIAAKMPPVTASSAILDYREKYKVRKRVDSTASPSSSGTAPPQQSDIVKRVLSRSSIFDQDSRRLEQIDEKYEPKDMDGVPLFWQKSATEDWPLLPPPMNTPLPTASLTAPSAGPPLPAVPAPLVVNLPLPPCSSAGATPISTPSLSTPPDLAPQSAPPTMENSPFPMPKAETSPLPATRPGPPKKGNSLDSGKKLPPSLPTPVLNSSPSTTPVALDMPELTPKKEFMAQDSPPILKKQESTESDWPATPPAKKEMPQLMAQTSRDVPKDTPTKDAAKDTGKKEASALLGKRKAVEDKEKPAGKADKHSSKTTARGAASHSKQEPAKTEEPEAKRAKVAPPPKDKKHDKPHKESATKESKKAASKHSKSPEKKSKQEPEREEKPKLETEKSAKPEKASGKERAADKGRKEEKETEAVKEKHKESSHREGSSHTERPVHRESSSHRELPPHKDTSHKEGSSHTERPAHGAASQKESSSHKDSAAHKENLLHKDNASCKEPSSHKDSGPHKDSSSHKDSLSQGSSHKDNTSQKDSSLKENPSHRDSSSHRDTSHKESVSHKENPAHRDSSFHRESSGHREGSSHRDSSAKDKAETKDKPDGADTKPTKDVKHKAEKAKDHTKEQNTADKGDKKDKVDKKEKSRSKSTDRHKDKTKEGSSDNRSKAKTDNKSVERADKHRSDKSHNKTDSHKTEKHDKKESDTKSETSDRSEDSKEPIVDRKESCEKPKEKSDSKTDSKSKDKSDKKGSKHSKSSHEKGKDEKEKGKGKEKDDHKPDKSSSKSDKDTKSDKRRTQDKSKKKESRQTTPEDMKAEAKAAPALSKRELRELGIEEETIQYVSMYDMVKRRSCKEREKEETKKQDEQKRRKQIQENRRRRSKSSRADDLYSSGIDSEDDEESETSVSTLESKRGNKKDIKKDSSKSKSARNWVLGSSSDDDDDDDSQESNSVAEILREKSGKKSPKVPKSPIYTESEEEDLKPKPKAKLKKKMKQISLESDSDLDDFPSKPAPKSKEPESAKKGRKGSKAKEEPTTPKTPNKTKGRERKERPKPPVFTSEESSDDIGPKLNSSEGKSGKKANVIESDEDEPEPESVPSTPTPEILPPPPPTPPTPSTPKAKNKDKKKDKSNKKKPSESDKKPEPEKKVEVEKEEPKPEPPADKSKEKAKSKTEGKKEESKDKAEEKKDRKDSPTKSKKNKHKDKGKKPPTEDSKEADKTAVKDEKPCSSEKDNKHDKKVKKEMKKEKKPDVKPPPPPDPPVKSQESHVSMVTKVLKSPHAFDNLEAHLDKIDPHILSPSKDSPLTSSIKKDNDLGMGILEKVNQDLNKTKPRIKEEQKVKREKSLDKEKSGDKVHDGPINKVHSGEKDRKEEKSGKKKKTKKKRKSVTDEPETPKNEPKCQTEAHEDPDSKLKDEARFRGDNIFEKMEMKEEVAEKTGTKEVKEEELPCIPHEDISQPGSEDIQAIQETVEITSGPDAGSDRLSSMVDADVLAPSGRQDCSRHNDLEENVPEPELEVKEEVVEESELPFDNISTEDITEEVVTTDTFTDTIHTEPVDIASDIAIVHEEEIREAECKVPEDTSTSYTLISNVSNEDVSDCEPPEELLPILEMQTVEVESLEAKKEKEAKLAVAGRLEVSAKETEAAVAGLEELLKLDEPEPGLVIAEEPPYLISDSSTLAVETPKPIEEPVRPEQLDTGMSEEEKAVLALAEIAELTADQINNELDDPDDDPTSKLVIAEPEDDRSVADEKDFNSEDKTEDSDVELGTPTRGKRKGLSKRERTRRKTDECSSGKESDNDMEPLLSEPPPDEDDDASKEVEKPEEDNAVNEMELMAAICSILPGSEEESAVAALQAQQDQQTEEDVPAGTPQDVPQEDLDSTAALLDDSDDIKEPDSQEALTIDESKQDDEEEETKETEQLEEKNSEEDKQVDEINEPSEPTKELPTDSTPQKTSEANRPDPFDEAKSIQPFREIPPSPFTENKPVSTSHYDIEKSMASHRQAKDPIHLDEDMDKPDFTSSENKPDTDLNFSTEDYSGGLDDSFTSDKMEEGSQSPLGTEKKEETRTRRSRKTRRQANREREEEEESSAKSPGRVTRSQYEELEQPRTPGRRGAQESTDKFSSYGRKIIPKERNDELTGFGRKGRKGSGDRSELEPRGRGRRGVIPEESKQEPTRTRRGRRASLRQNKEDENTEQDEMGQEEEKEEEKEAEGSDAEDTPGRSVRRTPRRRKSFRGRPGTRSYEREEEEGKEEEETRRFSEEEKEELDPPYEKEADSQPGESPRTRRGRRPKGRKSVDGSSSPRTRSADIGNASPRGRSLDGGATSPKAGEFSKPIVKLEKLNIDHTMKREERKEEELSQPRFSFTRHGMRQQQQQQLLDGDKAECKPEKDLYAWEDDDEKPVPELMHKRIRKRKAGGDSPRCPLFDDTSESLPDAKRKKPLEEEEVKKPIVIEKQETGEFKPSLTEDIKVEVNKPVEPAVPPAVKDIAPIKEQPPAEDLPKPTTPKTPLSAKPAATPKQAVTPKTTPPPKPIPAKPAVAPTKPAPINKPTPPVKPTPATKPTPEPVKPAAVPASTPPTSTTDTSTSQTQSNIDRIIDEVAKGNFERPPVVDSSPVPQPVPTKKRHSRSKSREDPGLSMSPRPHYPGPTSTAPTTTSAPVSAATSIPPTSSVVPASMSGLHGSPQVVFPPSRPDLPMSSGPPCSLPQSSKSSFLMGTVPPGISTSIPGMGQRSPMAKTGLPPMSQATSLPSFTMGTGSFMLERSGGSAQAGMRRPSAHAAATSVITQTPNPGGIPTQNPIQALQRAGYPVTPQELDKSRNTPRSQKSVSHSGPIRGVDSVAKSSAGSGPSTAGNSVHMGVVSQAYSIGQRDTSPPGQVNVIEIVPNPNLKSPGHDGLPSGPQKGKEDGRPASREGGPAGHGLPLSSMPGMQGPGQHGKDGHPNPLPGHLPAGMHAGFPGLYPGSSLVPSSTSGAPSTTATSELRAALATPSKLHQQEQLQRMQQQQQQQQPPPGMGPGMRPVTPHGPEHPGMVGHPRLSFPYQAPPPKTSPSADGKGHPFAPDLHKDGHGASAFTQLSQDRPGLHGDRPGMPPHGDRPGMPPHHGEVRPGMPPHADRPAGMHADIRPGMYPVDARFPHPPGMYPGSGLPMGMGPRMSLPGRMFPQHPDMFQGGMPPGLLHTQLPMGVPLEHSMERPGSARPPSNQSSQPSPRPTQSTPSPGAAGHPSPIPGPPHHAGPMVPQHPSGLPTGMAPRPAMGGPMMLAQPAVVAHHTDQLYHILNRYPVVWQGVLALKNDSTTVQMHTLAGSQRLIKEALPAMDASNLPLRIAQRMRLEQTQLEGVSRRMTKPDEFSMLLALPCGRDHMDVMQQTKTMRAGFIQYLQQKLAAGIVNVAAPGSGSTQPSYVVHIFPPCEFTQNNLESLTPELVRSLTEIDHLLIIIATVS